MASTGLSSSVPEADAASEGADIVVGVASYNSEATVAGVVRAVRDGLDRHFAGVPACIVLADGGSTDRTLELTRGTVTGGCDLVTTAYQHPIGEPLREPYHGLVGRSEAVRTILQAAQQREAKVCVIVDAGLTLLQPEWVQRLVDPILREHFDYASAHYLRHPYEGALTKSIVYPVFRALWGVRLRQPATGEFGCSARLVRQELEQGFWGAEGAETGVDLWLATAAANDGHRICEAALGVRAQAPRAGGADVSSTLVQVVGALFADVEGRADAWQRVRGSEAVPVFGELPGNGAPALEVNVTELVESFRLGYQALRDIWAWILPPKVILYLKRLADTSDRQFRIDDDIWARIVYDFALGYRLRTMPRDHLLGSLTPLYLGWLASYILELGDPTAAGAEQRIDRLADTFEREKPYLISRWRWPDRFRS